MKKFKRSVISLLAGCMMVMILAVTAIAASESLNGGGGTWSGGENADGILYSQVVDNKADGLAFKVTVWVEDDWGGRSEKSGQTSAVGASGKVYVSRAATHYNPFVANKCGYKNLVVVKA